MSPFFYQLALTRFVEFKAFRPYIARIKKHLIHFLMALRSNFEGLHRTILNRTLLPTVNYVVRELILDEIYLKSQVYKGPKTSTTHVVFVVP